MEKSNLENSKDSDKFYISIRISESNPEESVCNISYHLERIDTSEDLKLIIDNSNLSISLKFLLILTNDDYFLELYIFCINVDELKLLCELDYEKDNIRINPNYFNKLPIEVFNFSKEIYDKKIISACNIYNTYRVQDYEYSYICWDYEGWFVNRNFNYFKTPLRYSKTCDNYGIFQIPYLEKANLIQLNKIFNIDILKLDHDSDPKWEIKGEFLKYYDRVSCKRFFIKQDLLDILRENVYLKLVIETKLDKNFYIEYYAVDIEGFDKNLQSENTSFQGDSSNNYNTFYENNEGISSNWKFYNDNLDMDQQSPEFWDQF